MLLYDQLIIFCIEVDTTEPCTLTLRQFYDTWEVATCDPEDCRTCLCLYGRKLSPPLPYDYDGRKRMQGHHPGEAGPDPT